MVDFWYASTALLDQMSLSIVIFDEIRIEFQKLKKLVWPVST